MSNKRPLSKRAIFTGIASNMLSASKRCTDEDGTERYHYKKQRCAIGYIIPAELYSEEIEGAYIKDIGHLARKTPLWEKDAICALTQVLAEVIRRPLDDVDLAVLSKLQEIHDTVPVEQWQDKLNQLSSDFAFDVEFS